ncbi:MAG TPA: ABC transporter substrate-binding protein [Mycobacteriales bacterium]|nr:ABC transporter substrate-binding protein [Mycobacteriales bacterium]
MRSPLRALAGLAIVGLLAGCGTTLPDRDFNVLGSGKAHLPQTVSSNGTVPGVTGTATPGATTGPGKVSGGNRPGAGVVTQPGAGHNGGNSSGTQSGGGNNAAAPPAAATTCQGKPTASDVGVTPSTIKIGNIYSGAGNPFAPDQFIPNYYGVESYVQYINNAGGICGRKIQLVKCDDNGDRNQDITCAHNLIDQDKVFALVGDNVYQYSGASYISSKHVPDIGGEPITGNAYYTYPDLYSVIGSYYQNNGTPPPVYYAAPTVGLWFKQHLHLSRVGVIYYAQADSQRGANQVADVLKSLGVKVDLESVPLAGDPTPEVQDMKANHDQAIFDALDINGNQKVCAAMQQYGVTVPKISTISTWTQEAGQALSSYPCLKNYYSWGTSTNYNDTSNKQVSIFRQAYAAYANGAPLAQWSLEGWVAGMWFADAAASCGGNLTRSCVVKFANTKKGYSARGLMDPHTLAFPHYRSKPATLTQCMTIVKWAGGSSGGWQTVVDHTHNCHTGRTVTYPTGG